MQDVIGFYNSCDQAERVRDDLVAAGFDSGDINLYDRRDKDESGLWEQIKSAFGFISEEEQFLYAEAERRGAVAVALSLNDDQSPSAPKAVQIMERYHPIDLNTESQQWRQQGEPQARTQAQAQSQASSQSSSQAQRASAQPAASQPVQGRQEVIPVVQEELRVGKRAVQQGGVRIHSHVTQKPVQEQVQLRQEQVHVERRPADRPVTNADQAFHERTIEATETTEEPVVDKRARVVEEVSLNKDVQQRTQTVRDTVRRTDVDVEKIDASQRGQTGQTQWLDSFANELAQDRRYRGRDWSAVEGEARRAFEQRRPGDKWDQFKDSIRQGYDRARSHL